MTLRKFLSKMPEGTRRAINGLEGCPEGGWPETRQAWHRIGDELPKGRKGWGSADLVAAMMDLDSAGRYRVRE